MNEEENLQPVPPYSQKAIVDLLATNSGVVEFDPTEQSDKVGQKPRYPFVVRNYGGTFTPLCIGEINAAPHGGLTSVDGATIVNPDEELTILSVNPNTTDLQTNAGRIVYFTLPVWLDSLTQGFGAFEEHPHLTNESIYHPLQNELNSLISPEHQEEFWILVEKTLRARGATTTRLTRGVPPNKNIAAYIPSDWVGKIEPFGWKPAIWNETSTTMADEGYTLMMATPDTLTHIPLSSQIFNMTECCDANCLTQAGLVYAVEPKDIDTLHLDEVCQPYREQFSHPFTCMFEGKQYELLLPDYYIDMFAMQSYVFSKYQPGFSGHIELIPTPHGVDVNTIVQKPDGYTNTYAQQFTAIGSRDEVQLISFNLYQDDITLDIFHQHPEWMLKKD